MADGQDADAWVAAGDCCRDWSVCCLLRVALWIKAKKYLKGKVHSKGDSSAVSRSSPCWWKVGGKFCTFTKYLWSLTAKQGRSRPPKQPEKIATVKNKTSCDPFLSQYLHCDFLKMYTFFFVLKQVPVYVIIFRVVVKAQGKKKNVWTPKRPAFPPA